MRLGLAVMEGVGQSIKHLRANCSHILIMWLQFAPSSYLCELTLPFCRLPFRPPARRYNPTLPHCPDKMNAAQ